VDLNSNEREELEELRHLFAVQWDRMAEATARWRAEDPAARSLSMPDLGALLKWLMDAADRTHLVVAEEITAELQPEGEAVRGDNVDAWLKRHRETYRGSDGALTGAWYVVDALLDDYRDHADTGTPLAEVVKGPHED
jgi:hypothetical protein